MKRFNWQFALVWAIIFGVGALAWYCALSFAWLKFAKAGDHGKRESFYIEKWCKDHNGKTEVIMPDGARADCITDQFAVELGFATSPWENAPQALYYSKWTGKKPLVVIIVENPKNELKYLQRTMNTTYPEVTYEIWDVSEEIKKEGK